MKIAKCIALLVLVFSTGFVQANDETVKHDAEVARQRAIIAAAQAQQAADNAAALKAAQAKADAAARDKQLDALSKSVPSGSGAKVTPK